MQRLDLNNKIAIEKAFEVTLLDGKEEKKVWSTSTTVADFLKQHNIQLNEFDRVERKMEEISHSRFCSRSRASRKGHRCS